MMMTKVYMPTPNIREVFRLLGDVKYKLYYLGWCYEIVVDFAIGYEADDMREIFGRHLGGSTLGVDGAMTDTVLYVSQFHAYAAYKHLHRHDISASVTYIRDGLYKLIFETARDAMAFKLTFPYKTTASKEELL